MYRSDPLKKLKSQLRKLIFYTKSNKLTRLCKNVDDELMILPAII
jgi:hypothetical protein